MTSQPAGSMPDEPPPSYTAAIGPQTHLSPTTAETAAQRVRNGIPPEYRRSMEDEGRPLPQGWVRQYDTDNQHQFFVDTTREPPRSIWHHPYDDDEYMNSLDPQERQRIKSTLPTPMPSHADIAAESSEDDSDHQPGYHRPDLPPRPEGKPSFGRRMKDKITSTTHEQREEQRRQRAMAEQQAYERHRQLRQKMVEAMHTGQPQWIGKDRDGRDLYIEPPQASNMPMGGGYGYNPYAQGPYGNPNARFLRPANPYQRPYGRGYGGGYGLPIMGGLLGGTLLGGMLF